jgi:signal transduction histidine kinase
MPTMLSAGRRVHIGRAATLGSAFRPMRSPLFRPMRRAVRASTVGVVLSSAFRSFYAEPKAPDPPVRVWRDWALVAVVLVGGVLEATLSHDVPWPAFAVIVGVAPVFALLWRRTHPLPVAVVVVCAGALGSLPPLLGADEPVALGAGAYALLVPYALLRWGSGREATLGMAFFLVGGVVSQAVIGAWGDLFLGLPFLMLPAALGAAMRYRVSSRLRERDQVRLREREQLARELHDSVAHHVSAIAIRAQAGREVARSRPDAAIEALDVIEEAASRTLEELRVMVGALRDGDPPELAPQRGIADIVQLAGPATRGRPEVVVSVDGDLRGLRPSVEAAVFRIAQESVTNAQRHARHASRIEVLVSAEDDAIRLLVHDDGAATAPDGDGSGYGLLGMAERATLLGGAIEAGPGADGGWTVRAVLPRKAASGA